MLPGLGKSSKAVGWRKKVAGTDGMGVLRREGRCFAGPKDWVSCLMYVWIRIYCNKNEYQLSKPRRYRKGKVERGFLGMRYSRICFSF